MSPTNLSALPSNQPAPTGLCQIKRGGSTDTYIGWYNGVAPQALYDGVGGIMRIYLTPPRSGWWLIRAETMWYLGDAAWYYCHWGVRLSPLDADGRGDDRNHMCQHSALSWTEQVINTAYRVNAGTPYYAEIFWPNACNAGTWYYHVYQDYMFIAGEFIEDGSL